MITLALFSQSALLKGVADPVARNGICVALCDYWLASIKRSPTQAPAGRLHLLQSYLPSAISHQRNYARLRDQHGRENARRQVGDRLGLNYTDQTMVMRAFIGISGIRQKLAADISSVGSAATWTLRFADGGGHAIAGFCGISGQEPLLRLMVHVFDPNIGEYTGELRELDAILRDLLTKFPEYHKIVGVHRATED